MEVKGLIKEFYNSPIGTIELVSNFAGIISAKFTTSLSSEPLQTEASTQLAEYFSGIRQIFDLTLNLQGTVFQKKVWSEMLSIPYGKTLTYKEIACKIGYPKAVRAVCGACNRNPIIVIVPCHRVIGTNGKLTGYSGGLIKKQWLVEHEKAMLATIQNMDLYTRYDSEVV